MGRAGGTAVLPGVREPFIRRSRSLDGRGRPADARPGLQFSGAIPDAVSPAMMVAGEALRREDNRRQDITR
jgi:hypothetical protein